MKFEWKKHKNLANKIFFVLLLWFLLALLRAERNAEFSTVVSSISEYENLNNCELKTAIERMWPVSWTPQAMDVAMSDLENTIQMRVYGLFPPDRVEQDQYEYVYKYTTTDRKNGLMVSSYLQIHLNIQRESKWVEMGECKGLNEEEYWKNRKKLSYDSCTDPIIKIKCENA